MVVKWAGRLPEAFLAVGSGVPSRSLLQEDESLELSLETKSSLKSLCHWLDLWNFGGGSSPFRAVGMSSFQGRENRNSSSGMGLPHSRVLWDNGLVL